MKTPLKITLANWVPSLDIILISIVIVIIIIIIIIIIITNGTGKSKL